MLVPQGTAADLVTPASQRLGVRIAHLRDISGGHGVHGPQQDWVLLPQYLAADLKRPGGQATPSLKRASHMYCQPRSDIDSSVS